MAIALLTAFIIAYFLHVTARVPALGALRLDLVLGLAAFAATFMQTAGDKLRLAVPTSRRLLFFLAYIIFSLPLVTWPGSVVRLNLLVWIKVAFFFILVVGAVRSERQLKWILFVFLACQMFRVLEPLYLHVTEGYWGDIAYSHVGGTMSGLDRLSGSPYDVVNANQYAWVIVNTIPFLYFLLWKGDRTGKILFLAAVPASIYALLLTGSRSGLLSLAVVVVGILFFSEKKLRNLLITGVTALPVVFYTFGSLDDKFQARYLSIIDTTVAGGDTAQGRIDALIRQFGSVSQNPLFGNGLGTSWETNANVLGGRAQITHNMYIEILQETGLFGLTLFLAFIITMVKALVGARQALKESGGQDSWLFRVLSALLVWVAMDLVYSLSCFGISSWEWYFFGGVATVCMVLVQDRITQPPSVQRAIT